MQIKTTQTTENIVDVQLPFFRKRIDGGSQSVRYRAVLPDQTIVAIFQLEDTTHIRHEKANNSLDRETTEAYLLQGDWRICEEEDFLSFHMETLKSLSLEAVLVNAGKSIEDDLKDIDTFNAYSKNSFS